MYHFSEEDYYWSNPSSNSHTTTHIFQQNELPVHASEIAQMHLCTIPPAVADAEAYIFSNEE